MATRIPENHAAFTVTELLASTGGTLVPSGSGGASGASGATSVSTNTREMPPAAAFVALRGPTHDGHAYLGAAAAAGAAVAFVERDVDAPAGMTVVRVPSTLRALADLARAHVARWHAAGERTLIGITGSAGKTTTRVATAALVESLFPGRLVATRGNLNNRIGVPMMLFSLAREHRACVVELGTSEPGEIAELCRMAQPDVGILTLVAAAHLDGLGSIDGVEEEKAALFRALSPEAIAVGNGDDARVTRTLDATPAARRITYGRAASAGVRVVGRTPLGMTRSRVRIARADGRTSTFETPLVGEAGALACAAAVAACEAAFDARFDDDGLTQAFDRVQLGEGAQRLVPMDLASGLAVIDDTYNANPASMAFSIRAAAEMAAVMNRRLVLLLGEMRELGSEALAGHEAVGRAAAEQGARLLVAVGGSPAQRLADAARGGVSDVQRAPSVEEALPEILAGLEATDLVLVKGSRSVEMDRVVAAIERRFGPRRGLRPRVPEAQRHLVGDRQAGRQAGGLDTEQVDEAGDAVGLRALDHEVGRGRSLGDDLGADADVAGVEGAGGEGGIEAANGAVEEVGSAFVEGVIDVRAPAQIRAEAGAACEVEGDVDAMRARRGRGIDEVPEGGRSCEDEVVPAREVRGRDAGRIEAAEGACERGRAEAGRVDDGAGAHARRARAADVERDAVVVDLAADDGRREDDGAPRCLEVGAKRRHQSVAVEDGRRWRKNAPDGDEGGLEGAHVVGREGHEVVDAVGLGQAAEAFEGGDFVVVDGDEQLADAPVGEVTLGEVGGEEALARDAQARLEGAGGVVDARVAHLGIAGAGVLAGGSLGFEDDDAATGQREPPRHGEADDACADDDRVEGVHARGSVARRRGPV